jgi:hypothetical protein
MEPPSADRLAVAARALLDGDGRDHVLRPWQVAYLVSLAEHRPGEVPQACGIGRGWLDERLRAALAETDLGPDRPDA